MKPNKALRRLTEIEELMSDVVERFSTNAPSIRKALRDAVAAVAVAKEAVGLEATSGMANYSPVKDSVPTSATMPGIPKAKRKSSAGRTPAKTSASKKAATKRGTAKKTANTVGAKAQSAS
jgi:hypothetical protein